MNFESKGEKEKDYWKLGIDLYCLKKYCSFQVKGIVDKNYPRFVVLFVVFLLLLEQYSFARLSFGGR